MQQMPFEPQGLAAPTSPYTWPAIILTDVDPDQDRPDHAERLLLAGMTRATARLELVLRGGTSAAERLMIV
jgi:hypothetical protein